MTTPITTIEAGMVPASNDEDVVRGYEVEHSAGVLAGSGDMKVDQLWSNPPVARLPTAALGDYMSRPTQVASGSFSSSNTVMQVIDLGDPWALFLSNTAVASKVSTFQYFRGSMELTLVVSMPGNGYGMYVLSALPNGGASTAFGSPITLVAPNLIPHNCLQVDHAVVIDCGTSSSGQLNLPFLWPQDYAYTSSQGAGMWHVYATCISPLATAIPSGVTEATWRLYARSPDFELVVPNFQGKHKRYLPSHRTHGSSDQHGAAGLLGTGVHTPKALETAIHSYQNVKQHKTISSVTDKIAGAADMLSQVPVIGGFAKPVSQVAHAASKVAHWFGFSREDGYAEPQTVSFRQFSALPNVDGHDTSEKLSLSVYNTISVDPTLSDGRSEDCAAFSDLFPRWTLVGNYTWQPTDAADTLVFSIPVSPFFCMYDGTNYHLTTAGHCGLPFTMWRGAMHYKIFIPCSKVHRGSYQIAWIPNQTATSTILTNTTFNVIRELDCGVELDVEVAYASHHPALFCGLMTSSSIISDVFCNGRIVMKVMTPLRSPLTTASVGVAVFAAAAPDMQFGVPGTMVRDHTGAANPFYMIELQGADKDTSDTNAPVTFNIVPSAGTYPLEEMCFGESVASARAMMQKPSLLFNHSANAIFAVPPTGVATTLKYAALASPFPANVFTYAGFYRALFVGIAASSRFKVGKYVTNQNDFALWIYPVPTAPGVDYGSVTFSSPPPHLSQQYVTSTGGAEVEIPYYTQHKYLPAAANDTQDFDGPMTAIVPSTDTNKTNYIYHSFGADIRITTFRQVPGLTFAIPPVHTLDNVFYAS